MLLEKFRFTNLVKKFPNFMEFEISLPYSQEPAKLEPFAIIFNKLGFTLGNS